MTKFQKAHERLRGALLAIATEGYDVSALSADAPHRVTQWCDRLLRDVEPKERSGHGLSRLDARRTADEIHYLRGKACQFAQQVDMATAAHHYAIVRHNRRARDRARQLRAKRLRGIGSAEKP